MRITMGTVLVTAIIVGALKWCLPAFAVPNLFPVILAIPMMIWGLWLNYLVLAAFKPVATIRPDRLLYQHGQSARVIEADKISGATIGVHSSERIRLTVRYTYKNKPRVLRIGVPNSVDLNEISRFLPVEPTVRDARDRHSVIAV